MKKMAYREDAYYLDRILHHSDKESFACLVDKHQTMAFNIAMRITRNREEAEEVAQDAFVKLYHSLDQFKGDSKFTTWFYRIVYNMALARIRKKTLFDRSTDDEHFVEQPHDDIQQVHDNLRKKEMKHYIKEAINQLDESDQLLITLYYMDSQPMDEIAAITDLSVSNVKVRLHRTRKKLEVHLRKLLGEELQSIY